ncbi:hypothetical protein [Dickeya zeae]|uniref:hypothetical protein n=1 Tax=Dickeya zeae TaxID=204042 RepID=UPI002097A9E1|nr:hypothetical protein [Dickeya zeae]MCO7262944.1 hypothetical protein [Dickeya zeae]
MKKLTRFITLLSAAITLSGCLLTHDVVSGRFKYDPSHSYAWNVFVASKQDPWKDKDVSPEGLKLSGNKLYYWGTPDDSSPYNLSNIDLRRLITVYPPATFESKDWDRSGLIAWLPHELASDKESAIRLYIDTMRKATQTAFRNVVMDSTDNIMDKGYSSIIGTFFLGKNSGKTVYVGANFTDEELGCVDEYRTMGHRPDCGYFMSQSGILGIYEAPSFLTSNSDGKRYLFSGVMGASSLDVSAISRGDVINTPELARKRLRILQKLSKELPEWVFIYRAAENKYGLPALIMNKGITYFYIR